jgi:hypothetical protein
MFRPRNAPPTNAQKLKNIESAKVDEMSSEELSAHRMEIIALEKFLKSKRAETAVDRRAEYDEEAVRAYISRVVNDGFDLRSTTLSAEPEFKDAQKLKHLKNLIHEVVESGPFGVKQFKIRELRHQRSAIARSTTLHDLRQSIGLMIGPLQLYRELDESRAAAKSCDKAVVAEINSLFEELERKDALIEVQERMLSEIIPLYEPQPEKVNLLRQIEDFKALHQCSDKEAAKVFGTSDRTIRRLRKDYGRMAMSCSGTPARSGNHQSTVVH